MHLTDNERIFLSILSRKWNGPETFTVGTYKPFITHLIDDGVTTNIGEDEEKALIKKEWLGKTKGYKKLRERFFEGLWFNYGPRFICDLCKKKTALSDSSYCEACILTLNEL